MLSALIGAGLAIAATGCSGGSQSDERFDGLAQGMTQDEVEAILSKPGPDNEPLKPGSFRGLADSDKLGPTRIQEGVKTYWNSRREIQVTYKDGRLVEKVQRVK